ncbi:MAG: aminotransferase class III-fold pyridoxal phosphate-dependent enzyme, partial [Clostridia bacterium]|nr:aminotransferase class III-fold pyridoxal phosphate-dependent enzyme [Clostridia bacterium]
ALEVIKIMEKENLPAKSEKIGNLMISRLKEFEEKYTFIGDVRGLGAMVAFEIVKDRTTTEPDSGRTSRIIANCISSGLLVLKAGIYDNVVRMLVPLVATEEQLVTGLGILQAALEKEAAS